MGRYGESKLVAWAAAADCDPDAWTMAALAMGSDGLSAVVISVLGMGGAAAVRSTQAGASARGDRVASVIEMSGPPVKIMMCPPAWAERVERVCRVG